MLENTVGQSVCQIFYIWLVWLGGPLLHCTCLNWYEKEWANGITSNWDRIIKNVAAALFWKKMYYYSKNFYLVYRYYWMNCAIWRKILNKSYLAARIFTVLVNLKFEVDVDKLRFRLIYAQWYKRTTDIVSFHC